VALPPGAEVHVPARINPDSSFVPVAVASLRDHHFYTDTPALLPGALPLPAERQHPFDYVLLPVQETEGTGTQVEPVWANGQVALYTQDAASRIIRTKGPRRYDLALQGTADFSANTALVEIHRLIAVPPHAFPPDLNRDEPAAEKHIEISLPSEHVIGIDIYGESACTLQHFGFWGTPDTSASAIRIALDLPTQAAGVQDLSGTAIATSIMAPSEGSSSTRRGTGTRLPLYLSSPSNSAK
jgi:hypothetical protein